MAVPLEYVRPQPPTKSSKAVWALAIFAMVCGLLSGPVGIALAILPFFYDLPFLGGPITIAVPLAAALLLGGVARITTATCAAPLLRVFADVGIVAPIVWGVLIYWRISNMSL